MITAPESIVSFMGRNLLPLVCFICLNLCMPLYSTALVRVTGFADFTFGTWSGSGDMVLNDGTLCTYKSTGGKNYKIRATGSGTGGALTVASGSYTIAYTVGWKASQGTSGTFTNLLAGQSQTFTPANTASQTCGGSFNAAMRVTLTAAALGSAKMGAYSGTLTILMEP